MNNDNMRLVNSWTLITDLFTDYEDIGYSTISVSI